MKDKTILVVAAHPDDAEFGCSGSVAKWTKEGAKVFYLVCTNGNKGSSDPKTTPAKLANIRHQEQLEAANVLGVKRVFFLAHNDCELEPNLKLKDEIVKVIRKIKPDVVLTFDPKMRYSATRGYVNHPDHIATGEATLVAVYPCARNRLTFPHHEKLGLLPHAVNEVLLFNFDEANFFVDIANTIDKKLQALKCHKSQIGNFTKVEKRIKEWSSKLGKKIGAQYAEGFKRITLEF